MGWDGQMHDRTTLEIELWITRRQPAEVIQTAQSVVYVRATIELAAENSPKRALDRRAACQMISASRSRL
jgi:hypothetical protein